MDETEDDCLLSDSEEDEGDVLVSSWSGGTSSAMAHDGEILPQKNKRKRTDVRRRIRKILKPEQLDSQTVSAQKEEQERLRRLELQKSLSTLKPGYTAEGQAGSMLLSDTPQDKSKVVASPMLVNVPNKTLDQKSSSIIVIDDSDDDDCNVVETRNVPDRIIEISDSGSGSEPDVLGDSDVDDEREPETSGSHTNDDVNQPDAQGMVLVNVNHPPAEPDIFLSPYLSQCVKPHQIGGIRFLYDNLVESLSRFKVSPGLGCILAHSMGLGKTLQLICLIDVLLNFTKATKVLCIVPMNTIQNWYSEFATWLPEKSPNESVEEDTHESDPGTSDSRNKPTKSRNYKVFLLSDNVKTTVARSTLIGNWHENGGVLLMGYEMYRILAMYSPSLVNNTKLTSSKRKKPVSSSTTEVIDLDEEEKNMDLLLGIQNALCKPGPDLVVCDEGHRIKNNQANISQALKKVHTRRRVVLTGYPLQNNLLEYWCMVDFVRPNFLGTRHEFSNMFERPIVNGQCVDSTASDTKLMRFRAHVLHSLLEGFVQRRSEAVLTKTLPEKEEYVIPVKMSPIQMSLYESFVTSVRNDIGYVNPIRAFSISIKIWNHPDILKQYLDRKRNGARNDSPLTVVDADLDIGENLTKKSKEVKNEASRRTAGQEGGLVSSEVKANMVNMPNSTLWVGNLLDNYEPDVLQNGTKMVILTEIIEKTVAMGDKILVFSQSLSTLSIIEDFLHKRVVPPRPSQLLFQPVHWERNKNYYRLDGGTSSQEREKLITAFNMKTNQSVFVFLLSTRACSLGVNLVGANRVVVFDASWNPCHDAQAVCRIYRYGQTKKCFIYRLVSSGTFEKRMYERQVTKQGMSDRVIDELNPVANLTKQEVMNLFNEAESEKKESKQDVSSLDKFADPVLNHVCATFGKCIEKTPFKHKLQTSQRSTRNTLTKAEKREAKKGYEREKLAISSTNKFVPLPGNTSAIVREQMRRELNARPVGHVKPIQNFQPDATGFGTSSLSVRPAFPNSLSPLPSMLSLSSMSHPTMSYARYFPPGQLRPFPPFPIDPPTVCANIRSRRYGAENPVVVNLLTSPTKEDAGGTPCDGKDEVDKTAESICIGGSGTSVNFQAGGFCFSGKGAARNNVVFVDNDARPTLPGNPCTGSENDANPSLSLNTTTPSDGNHAFPGDPSKCGGQPRMTNTCRDSENDANPSLSLNTTTPSDGNHAFPGDPSKCGGRPRVTNTCRDSENDANPSLSLNTATPSNGDHVAPGDPSKCGDRGAGQPHVANPDVPVAGDLSDSVESSTRVENDGSPLSADAVVPGENVAGQSTPVGTTEQSSDSQNMLDNAEEKMDECGALVADAKSEQAPSCSREIAEA